MPMELLVVRDSAARRLLAAGVGLAAVASAVAIGFSAQAADGSRSVLGLGVGEWRAVINPALAVVLIAALATLPARPAAGAAKSAASGLILSGLALVLLGNVADFGLLGGRQPSPGVGSAAVLAATLLGATGVGALAAAAVPFQRPRPVARVTLAALITIIGVAVALAVPAAVAMLATGVMDALLTRGSSALVTSHKRIPLPAGAA